MKRENYFNSITANEVLQRLNKEVRLKEHDRELSRSALLVLDMQKYFTDPVSHAFVPSTPDIIKPINGLINYYNENNRPVIMTRHINNEENAGMMKLWWRDVITDSNPLVAFNDNPGKKNIIEIIKPQYDAFYKTELESLLEKNKIDTLVLTGVMTHLCLETTARSAFVRGYKVIVPVDTTATYNYDLYYSSLRALAHGFSFITTSWELISNEQ